MEEEKQSRTEVEEISPAELLRVILDHKTAIGLVTLGVGVLTALFTLSMPNIYESSAGLLIKRPEIQVAGETTPLTPDALLELTDSTQVKHLAYDHLVKEGTFEEDPGFEKFQRMLQVSPRREKGSRPVLLPLVEIKTRTEDSLLAKHITNEWAKVVVEQSNRLYESDVEGLKGFMGNIYSEAISSLTSAEIAHATKVLGANLEIEKPRLASLIKRHSEFAEALMILDASVETNARLMAEVSVRVSKQEEEGIWVGEKFERDYRAGQHIPLASPTLLSSTIESIVKSIIERETELIDFLQTTDAEYKQLELDTYSKQLEKFLPEVDAASQELAAAIRRYATLKLREPSIDKKLVLRKAITDDPMWEAWLEGKLPDSAEMPWMITEEENPVRTALETYLLDAEAEVEGLKETVRVLQDRKDEIRKEVSSATKELEFIRLERETKERGINGDRARLNILREEYDNERSLLEVLRINLEKYQADRKLNSDLTEGTKYSIVTLSEKISDDEVELKSLEREIEKLASVAKSLISKAGQTALLKLEGATPRSGTAILYRAEANPQKVGPHRSKYVLAAMALAFIFSCGFVVIRSALQEA